jgi:hypothetical protein
VRPRVQHNEEPFMSVKSHAECIREIGEDYYAEYGVACRCEYGKAG